jgi:hypothetical protein
MLELAPICEEVVNNIEDHLTVGSRFTMRHVPTADGLRSSGVTYVVHMGDHTEPLP